MQKSPEAEINSVLDIRESRQIKETVVAAVGADEILETNRQHVLFSAIGSARSAVSAWLFAEYLDNSWRAPDQIESQLGIPVVTTIPRDTRGKSSEKVLRFFKSQAC